MLEQIGMPKWAVNDYVCAYRPTSFVIAYNSLTPIYPGLTALNIPTSQNFMNESTKGSP